MELVNQFSQYQVEAQGVFKPAKLIDIHQSRILNWALGITNEAGEMAGLIKHHIFHGEELNKMELAKELGDILWYVAALCTTVGIPMEVCATLNIEKLRHRHGAAYSAEGSSQRHSKEGEFADTEVYQALKHYVDLWGRLADSDTE